MRLLRIIPLALLIALVASPAQAWMSPALCGGGVAVGGCTKSDIPNGDVYKESFEDAGYDLGTGTNAWNETGSLDEDYSLAGKGTASNENCSYGLQASSTGTSVHSDYHLATGRSEIWREFSFYVVSHSLTDPQTASIACGSTSTGCSGQVIFRIGVRYTNNGGGMLQLYGSADTQSTVYQIVTGKWYYVRTHCYDRGACTGVDSPYVGCTGTGTGNCSMTVGETYGGSEIADNALFTASDLLAGSDEFSLGVMTEGRTVDIIFGYDTTDDDGSF